MKETLQSLVLCAGLAGFPLAASATIITPGGATVAANNAITVTNDGVVGSVSGALTAKTFSGSYTELVFKDGSNPFGVDDLTFIITVMNNASSPNGIEHIANGDGSNSFSLSPAVNVGYLAGVGEDGTDFPDTIDETIYGTVEFNFTNTDNIAPGTGTQYLVIQTAATNLAVGNLSAIDSSADTENGFVPALAAVSPEPSSFLLLGTGLVGGTGALWKRRRQLA